ncbi:D-alanyl-D-alanine carboxypeptidase [Streptomyces sp. NBC_01520]|uniref:D-alanyl-D-alanine carboxypeptidase n=1 Tax=Streptomyces sp. NBC_01520 TaxID=2903892 RepID=UPI003864931D
MSPRRMKEASVAGESPDKSEQRKSSGTAEERDPRFAVFREPVAAAGTGSTTGRTTDTVTDTATAVFRSPYSADTADGPDEVSSDAPEGGSEDTGSETGTDRAEAAAASGSEPEGPEASTEGSEAPQEGSAGRGAAEGPAGATEADEATRSEAVTPAPDVPSTAESAVEPEPEPDSDSGSRARPDTGTASGTTTGSGDASGSGADAESEEGSGTEPVDVTASGSAAEDEPDDAPEAGTAPDAAAGTQAEDGAQDEPGDEPRTDGDAGTGTPSESRDQAEPAEDADEHPEPAEDADEHPEADEQADQAAPAGKASDAAETADAKAADEPADSEPASADSSEAPRVPKSRTETPTTGAAPEPAPEDSKPAGDERGVDQPTTAFKALRPKQVDHPTTALKLPPRSDLDAKSEPKPTPETPAERTSKFVPLRADDIRPGAVGGPPVGPTVTPDVTAKPDTPKASPMPAYPVAGLVEAERTRQQPMPPKPPLDLLAELTNTPPPPQTPVRTVFRRIKIWTPLVLLLVVVFAIAQAMRPLPEPTLALSVASTYTFDGEKLDMPWPAEGQGAVEVEGVGTIGTYGTEKSAPIASVAKIMTAYVILQGHPITGRQDGEEIVVDETAGEEADRPDESTAPIEEGQKYTQRQMLQLLMIPSGNNVARLLARWDATTVDAFVGKMNAAAKDLGMTKSVYTDPSGLESSTRSTPADQLKLAKAVMQNDVFREIVNMPQADIPGIGKTIYNNNVILLEPGVSGIKTGSSTPAGGNLVWTADTVIDGKSRRIIGAVMGADLDGTLDAKLQRAIQNSLKLIQAAQKGVESATVVKKGQVVGYVDNGLGGRTPVVSTKDLKAVGWGGLEVELDLGDGGEPLQHAAKAGTVVGEVTVGTGTGKVSAPVALQSEMTEPAFGDRLTRIT